MLKKSWIKLNYHEPNIFCWIGLILELISAAALFFLMLLTCTDVMGRYLFNNAIDGAVEMTQIGLAILVFAQMPLITWRGNHVVVDLLDNLLGNRIVRILSFISVLIISASFYYLGTRIFYLANRSIRRGELTEYLGIPAGYITQYIAIMSWVTAACMLTFGSYLVLTKSFSNKSVGE